MRFHQLIAHSHQFQKAYWKEICVGCQVRFSCYGKDVFSFRWCHCRPSFKWSHQSKAQLMLRFQRWDLCLKSSLRHLDYSHPCQEVLQVLTCLQVSDFYQKDLQLLLKVALMFVNFIFQLTLNTLMKLEKLDDVTHLLV